ncbi:MAG: hypothetical protein HY455_01360 [Parcubacteria group bacterium]|nr:hypothetical protein [Parcubacteria group bacterium]
MVDVKTAFIPKKTLPTIGTRRSEPVGLFMVGGLVIFFSSLLIAGGLYFYRALLTTQIEDMSEDVVIAKEEIQPKLIESITRFDKRVTIAETLIGKHLVATPLFFLLEDATLPTVRYDRFSANVDDDGSILLTLTGEARTYKDLAVQADIFGRDENITEPIFSGLRLNNTGNVAFQFTGRLKPAFLLLESNLTPTPATP